MSHGSLFLQSEYSNRVTAKIARMKQEHDKRLVHYEKNFDVNLSRIENRERSLRESMLAYIERMRSIADSRRDGIQSDPLFIRAKHIPKYPQKGFGRRRPVSLDELIGRGKDHKSDAAKPERRPLSEWDVTADQKTKSSDALSQSNVVLIPALTKRPKKIGSSVQFSFVSASNPHDIVDFSLKSKETRQDSTYIPSKEREAAEENSGKAESSNNKSFEKGKSPRASNGDKTIVSVSLPHINITNKGIDSEAGGKKVVSQKEDTKISIKSGDEKDTNEDKANDPGKETELIKNKDSFGKINTLRARPKRAKRMRLRTPNLRGIPEDEVLPGFKPQRDSERKHVVSPPPSKQSYSFIASGKSSILSVIPKNVESILNDSGSNWSRRNEYHAIPRLLHHTSGKSTRRILMKDDGDVRIEVTQCLPKQDFPMAKLKTRKRFKKLVYLRDVTDRHSQTPRV
ncbi:hypothetical protein CHS0354_007786 [Potamilus streckersoni]|uniref:Uncharacterized protein n=1 Tax=Potamilus streckersoni TaxID=2493646 RepID=A0AAE0TFN6_9BIVA|nr:hypothetical protein CHS0354_007786 [Potamilus streckersoni]